MRFITAIYLTAFVFASTACKADNDCEDCLDNCEYNQLDDDLPESIDCYDYCVYLEECDPQIVFVPDDAGLTSEDSGPGDTEAGDSGWRECWTYCPVCEFADDPGEHCRICVNYIEQTIPCTH